MTMSLFMRVGAALDGSFRSSIGQALRGISDMEKGAMGLQSRLMDIGQAAAGLYGLGRMVNGAATLSAELKDAGITAEITNERIGELRQNLRGLSSASATNRSTRELVGVYRELVGAGLDDSLAGNEALLQSVGRTGTATKADLKDLARTTYGLVEVLGIKPEGLADEFDRLAYLGGKGRFELEHMAQYFPQLAPQMKLLGVTGTEAVASMGAALQVAMDSAGSQGEGANQMRNFLIKATSPETVKKFKEAGEDLKAIFGKAMAEGKNPMEVLLTKIDGMLGTDATKRKFRLGALFEDQEAQAFVTAMLEGREKYEKLKGASLSGEAKGKVDKDYARRMEEFTEKSNAFANAVGNLGDSIGRSFLPPLGAALTVATPVVTWLSNFSDAAPGTTLAITGMGAGLMVLSPALRLASFATRTFGLSNLFAAGGIKVLGAAIRSNPIGLAVSGIALLGGVIYDNWAPIKGFFTGIWDDVQPAWTEFSGFVMEWADIVITPLRTIQGLWKDLGGALGGKGLDFSNTKAAIGQNFEAAAKMADRAGVGDSVRQLGARAMGAMGTAGAPGADGKVQVQVDFANLPRGVETRVESSGKDFDVDTRTGYQMAGP